MARCCSSSAACPIFKHSAAKRRYPSDLLTTGSSPRFLTDVLQRGKITRSSPVLDGTHMRSHAKEGTLMK
jgi:hypothetical protein